MNISLVPIAVTTDGSGDATVEIGHLHGRLKQIRYVPDGSNPLATGADVTITGQTTGLVILNMTNIGTSAFNKCPKQPIHDVAGVASLYAAAGEPVEDDFYLNEQFQLVVAQGGDTDSGTFYLFVER